MNNKRLLFVGNYFNQNRAWEEIPVILAQKGYVSRTTSAKINRVIRFLDMIVSILFSKREYDIAIVDIFSGLSMIWALVSTLTLSVMGKPIVLVLRGGGLVEYSNNHPKLLQLLFSKADVVSTASMFLKTGLSGIKSDIYYLPEGLEIRNFEFAHRKNVQPNLVWVRALHQIYQPQVAIEAISKLKTDYPNVHLEMAGSDKQDGTRAIVENLIRNYNLQKEVNWIGQIPRSSVQDFLQSGDLFLNTTLYESFGMSVLEAAACGLCIVTTNVGELPYMWEDGVDALLVPPNDPEAMAAAVRRILTEPGLAARLSANARKKAEKYDWSVIIPRWEALFNKILQS